jgi:predicted ATPase/class 3 adenylate cyclase
VHDPIVPRRQLPSGTVTFLFTDVEGSTSLLTRLGDAAYADALAAHRTTVRAACAAHGGVEVDTQGDAFFIAFPTASGALAAAADATESLAAGPIRVRMGIHTGTPLLTDEGYVGVDVHEAARIAAAGHGGQVLVSRSARELLEGDFLDLGEHRLKDFATPVWIYQLGTHAFPPLATISNTNLPRPATPLVGRRRELEEITELIGSDDRLVTLTGAGGTGKTRLAIEAATHVVGRFRSGVFWVDAAPMREPGVVIRTIAQTVGARGDLAEHIGERAMLLVVDNLEQVPAVGADLAALVERCPNLHLLLTSRERLRVRGEHELPVPTLVQSEAVELFCARAGARPTPDIGRLCAALDNLPLAVELAAARATVLAPAQILERLSGRLDLLRGTRDADPRQQTLRATIDWSHDLLDDDERRLFARLGVFAGGADLDAIESVTDARLDTIESLVDKSLLRHAGTRFGMLESIRAYAAERLAESGERDAVRRRHADRYLDLAERMQAILESGEPEEGPVDVLDADIDNLRAAVEFGLETGDAHLVRRITAALSDYWMVRGLHREGRAAVERALALSDERDHAARRLHSALAIFAYAMRDHRVAVDAADEAAIMAGELAGTGDRSILIRDQAVAALLRDDLATAEALFEERLPIVMAAGNGVGTSSCRINLALIANHTHRHDRARDLLEENLTFVRSRGQTRCEATTLSGLAETAVYQGRSEIDAALTAARLAMEIRDPSLALFSLDVLAATVARDDPRAATILGGTEAVRRRLDLEADPDEAVLRDVAAARLGGDPAAYRDEWSRGAALDLPDLILLATDIAAERTSPTYA